MVFFSAGWLEVVSLGGTGLAQSEANLLRRQSSHALSRDRMLLLSMAGREEYPGVPPTPLHVPPTSLHVPSLGLLSGPCSWLQRNQNPVYPSLGLHRVAEEQRETGDTVQEKQLRQLSGGSRPFQVAFMYPIQYPELWAS